MLSYENEYISNSSNAQNEQNFIKNHEAPCTDSGKCKMFIYTLNFNSLNNNRR